MPISEDEFLKRYPTLYHVTLRSNAELIRTHGLRSTTGLLDLFGITGEKRHALERCRRPQMVTMHHPLYGQTILNDQAPLNETVLAKRLVGMTAEEWIMNLNRRVFLWPDLTPSKRFLASRLARNHQRVVLGIQTRDLLQVADSIELSAINSGTAVRNAPLRGPDTFLPLALYPFAERSARYGSRGAVAEVTIPYSISDGDLFFRVDGIN